MSKDKLAVFVQTRRRDATLLTWFRFIRVLKKLLPQMDEHLRHWGLSQGQFDLLAEIAAEEGINQQTCANRLNVTKGNVTQHLSNLEKSGYIQREKSGRDSFVSLTDEGRSIYDTGSVQVNVTRTPRSAVPFGCVHDQALVPAMSSCFPPGR